MAKKEEKSKVESNHPKKCHCPKCLDRKFSAAIVILDKEIKIFNNGLKQLENELNHFKQIQKMIWDFLKEHHRAQLLADNSKLIKRKRSLKRWILKKRIHKGALKIVEEIKQEATEEESSPDQQQEAEQEGEHD